MVTELEILDTSIKIGLGAVISGVATYLLARANHYKTIEKERAQRKRDMLEVVAQQVATFHQLALRHWGFAANWTLLAYPSETEETALTKIRGLRDELNAGYQELTSAEAKLLPLGEETCQKLLQEYGTSVTIYQEERIMARTIPKEAVT